MQPYFMFKSIFPVLGNLFATPNFQTIVNGNDYIVSMKIGKVNAVIKLHDDPQNEEISFESVTVSFTGDNILIDG